MSRITMGRDSIQCSELECALGMPLIGTGNVLLVHF